MLRRLPADYLAACGRPAVAVETFTDPARGTGTAYTAAGFTPAAGYARTHGLAPYVFHGRKAAASAIPWRRSSGDRSGEALRRELRLRGRPVRRGDATAGVGPLRAAPQPPHRPLPRPHLKTIKRAIRRRPQPPSRHADECRLGDRRPKPLEAPVLSQTRIAVLSLIASPFDGGCPRRGWLGRERAGSRSLSRRDRRQMGGSSSIRCMYSFGGVITGGRWTGDPEVPPQR
jgi:hypothetical protein